MFLYRTQTTQRRGINIIGPISFFSVVLMVIPLMGCASNRVITDEAKLQMFSCNTQVQPQQRVKLDLIDRYMKKNKYYAALAHLEQEAEPSQEHWLKKGQLLAKTGQLEDSKKVFLALAEQCNSAGGFHGMGMVSIKQKNYGQSLEYLKKAMFLDPASESIRNDLGYALMLNGKYQEATVQLRTALELGYQDGPAKQNLAAAYILSGDTEGISLLKSTYALTEEETLFAQSMASHIGDFK